MSLRLEGVSIFHEDEFVPCIPPAFIECFSLLILVTSRLKPGVMVTKTLLNVIPGDNSIPGDKMAIFIPNHRKPLHWIHCACTKSQIKSGTKSQIKSGNTVPKSHGSASSRILVREKILK